MVIKTNMEAMRTLNQMTANQSMAQKYLGKVTDDQLSESTIRDADMAKEMPSYAKYNLLSQTSQAMLAQANQNPNDVLYLLGGEEME